MDLMKDIIITAKLPGHTLKHMKKQKWNFFHILTYKNMHHMILSEFHTTKESSPKKILFSKKFNFLGKKNTKNQTIVKNTNMSTDPF
tara:strand:+ start:3127 stop:3387 length:261 start_codon:yes stop_codon:yes gene_type:complete